MEYRRKRRLPKAKIEDCSEAKKKDATCYLVVDSFEETSSPTMNEGEGDI